MRDEFDLQDTRSYYPKDDPPAWLFMALVVAGNLLLIGFGFMLGVVWGS